MGLALAKTAEIEEKEENDIQYFYKVGQSIAVDLIQYRDEIITKMCAVKLYESLLGVYDDYYNIGYGRKRRVWEKVLKNHILAIRKTCRMMLSYGLILKAQIPNYIFNDDPFAENTVDFRRVESLIFGLLTELQRFNNIVTVFK